MPRFHGLILVLGILAALLWAELPGSSRTAALPSTGLVGTVQSADGKPMEGVAVSARAQDKNISTSVYTNQEGEYFFPPLDAGEYRMWAQAVGFELTRAEKTISSGRQIRQDFTLKPVADFSSQLSDAEWMESLPDDTPADRRMKKVIHNNCVVCHGPGFALAKRFDAAGWGVIMNTMIEKQTLPDSPNRKLLQAYKEDLIAYLTKVRGPGPSPMKRFWRRLYPWQNIGLRARRLLGILPIMGVQ